MSARLPLADIAFISDFAAFCRTKGDEGYNYGDNGNCACSRFLRETGRATDPWTCVDEYWLNGDVRGESLKFPDGVGGGDGAVNTFPHTFSALATRLEALIVDAPVVVPQP